MIARDLSREIWNGIADLVGRSRSPREVYYAKVSRSDPENNLVWVKDFGEIAIPLVAHGHFMHYYDEHPTGANVVDGTPVATQTTKRKGTVEIACPNKGDLVVILDPWGAKRFPICIGVIQSNKGFWEGD